MDKGLKQYAVIEIEYFSIKELKYALENISNELAKGNNYGRKNIANAFVQYQNPISIEPEYRIEIINGQECMIFKSKMNKNGK